MKCIRSLLGRLSLTAASFACSALIAQVEAPPPTAVPGGPGFGPGPGGPGGGRGPGGPGFGGPAQERKILSQFDKNGDKVLNAAERQSAREFLAANPVGRGRGGPPGGGRGRGAPLSPAEPGKHLTPADVKTYGQESLYDPTTLRTLFFTFEDADWEKEMDDFHRTDVDVPATLAVDGKTYRDVGLHFRGASSYSMVPAGRKRSLAVSVDMAHDEQTLLGYRTLNLLNSHEDASFLRAPLFSYIAQNYVPAPRMNFVRVVINGENWGIYANAEQFNKEFAKDRLGTAKGARWKVPGSPGGRGGLAYLGPDAAAYKGIYEIKSKDEPKSWTHFIEMCRVLNETPPDKLEAALSPLLDIDGALKFLALDIALVNGDGYWTRTSDYSIAEDSKGQLHVFPHDMNETFSFGSGFGPAGSRGRGGPPRGGPPQAGGAPGDPARGGPPAQGPGGPAGPGGGFGGPPGGGNNNASGITLDPLIDGSNENTPLVTKLLAVPALRARYLGYVRDIASTWLDWSRLGPVAKNYHTLIDADVKRDTRKLETYEDFVPSVEEAPRSLKAFADQRRAFLLNYPEIKNLGASAGPAAK